MSSRSSSSSASATCAAFGKLSENVPRGLYVLKPASSSSGSNALQQGWLAGQRPALLPGSCGQQQQQREQHCLTLAGSIAWRMRCSSAAAVLDARALPDWRQQHALPWWLQPQPLGQLQQLRF